MEMMISAEIMISTILVGASQAGLQRCPLHLCLLPRRAMALDQLHCGGVVWCCVVLCVVGWYAVWCGVRHGVAWCVEVWCAVWWGRFGGPWILEAGKGVEWVVRCGVGWCRSFPASTARPFSASSSLP